NPNAVPFTPLTSTHSYYGKGGVHSPKGWVFARDTKALRGEANVAAGFYPTGDGAGAVISSRNGTDPFIGAFQDASGNRQNFAVRVGGTFKTYWSTSAFYPATPGGMTLGGQSYYWGDVYSAQMTINDGVTAPATVAGKARICVDVA